MSQQSQNKINLLLEAPFCNPDLQSVSLIGFKWFRELQELTNLTLLTTVWNKRHLEPYVKQPTQIVYIDPGRCFKYLNFFLKPLPDLEGYVFYWIFTHLAKKAVRKIIKEGQRFDVHHKVTPVSVNTFSAIPSLGIPSIVGPLNSGMSWPKGFGRSEYAKKQRQSVIYHFFSNLLYKTNFAFKFRKYKKILVSTKTTLQLIPKSLRSKCVLFSENGVDVNEFKFEINDSPTVNCLYVGRLIPFKAVDILIQGFRQAFSENSNLRLTIVGTGTELSTLEELVNKLGIKEFVTFIGEIPHAETVRYFQKADIFLLSSLRESGGAVVLEAMSCGAVPIVVDHGGPGEVVTKDVGIKIEPRLKEQLVKDFYVAISRLACDKKLRFQMAQEGRAFAEKNFSWLAKSQKIISLYKS